MSGRVILVTGAAVGFGRETALLFAEAGERVFALDRDSARLSDLPDTVTPLVADLLDRAAIDAVVAEIASRAGPVEVLVNNAGGTQGHMAVPVDELDPDDWNAVLGLNLTAPLLLARAVAGGMKAAGKGRIINTSSGAGFRPSRTGVQAYTSAKHGLHGLTRQLAFELGPFGITVNAVAPGLQPVSPFVIEQWESYGPQKQAQILETIPLRSLGTARDVAEAVAFLASDKAGYITGQILPVNGGAY